MRRLLLIIQLIGLSALLLGSIVGSLIIIALYLLFVGLAIGGGLSICKFLIFIISFIDTYPFISFNHFVLAFYRF